MTVAGTGFDATSTVQWNGAALSTQFNNTTTLTATVTPNLVATSGTASVSVLNSAASGGLSSNSLPFTITSGGSGSQPPFIVRQPSANPNPVTGARTTQLDVLGGTFSSGGESVLTYTWTVTGPAVVNLSANGTNAAKTAIAAFTALGTYTFQAQITDTVTNLSTTSNSLTVDVNPGVASITVSPKTVTLSPGQLFNFTATTLDQFGAPFNTPVTWSANSGAISANSGMYTAPVTNQMVTVTASAQGKSDTAQVTIVVSGAGGSGGDLSNAKVGPVPFKANSGDAGIHFMNLPPGTRIRLFTMTGRIVQTLDVPNGGNTLWQINNANNDRVASGVYLYIIEGAGQKKEGKLVVIQ
jgi:hypothetical protein